VVNHTIKNAADISGIVVKANLATEHLSN